MTSEQEHKGCDTLFQLIQENPGLPVVPMVYGEIVAGDDCAYWRGRFGRSEVTRYWIGAEKVHFYDESDQDEICQTLNDEPFTSDYEDAYDYTDEENLEAYRALPWTEAIVVYIELP